jgi:hypothetical protein
MCLTANEITAVEDGDGGGGGLSTAAIVGIVIGGVVMLAVIVTLGVLYGKTRRHKATK